MTMNDETLFDCSMINVCAFGADNSGICDSSDAFARAVDAAKKQQKTLYVPTGMYTVSKTIRIPSDFRLYADPTALIRLDGNRKKRRGDFLLSNDDPEHGNVNIHITGGVWDGNNQGIGNAKPDIFNKNGYSGAVLNFVGVKGLHLSDFTVANSVTYYIRMARLENFIIKNISFVSDEFGHNQDGLHFGGAVRHGVVRNIRALSCGQTNDDLIALNADDSIERVENLDLVRDGIEDLLIENLFAENCHTIIRLLSVTAPIRNIVIRNVYGGYRGYAINLDAARYCKTPLFKEEDIPNGCGVIENVCIEHMICRPMTDTGRPAVCMESCVEDFSIRDFKLLNDEYTVPALVAKNLVSSELITDADSVILNKKSDKAEIALFRELIVRSAHS